jgi:hypothetical protein
VTRNFLQRSSVAAVVALWALSLALAAVRVQGGPELRGIDLLSRGWEGLESGVYAWLANPFFLVAAVLCWLKFLRTAALLAGAGCMLALTSFGAAGAAARAGASVPDFAFQGGFYLWLAAHFALLVCCWPRIFARGNTAQR